MPIYDLNMPELPDVEAVINKIKKLLVGRDIGKIIILDNRLTTKLKLRPIPGKRIERIWRRGKYILVSLDNDYTLVIHLRMTGDLLIVNPKSRIDAHTRIIIRLSGNKEIRFVDPRRLGILYVIKNMNFRNIDGLNRMGPEPLAKNFTFQKFNTQLQKKKGMIKSLIMDQHFIAGIGNIYGDEILFQSKIRPTRKARELTKVQIQRLYNKIRYVLKKACEKNADLSEMSNWFVHGRDEGCCINCKCKLKRVRIQGRYSYYCPRCQR